VGRRPPGSRQNRSPHRKRLLGAITQTARRERLAPGLRPPWDLNHSFVEDLVGRDNNIYRYIYCARLTRKQNSALLGLCRRYKWQALHVYIYICMYMYIYIYIYVCVSVCIFICIYVNSALLGLCHRYKWQALHVYIYICMYMYMCVCVCVYIYIYMYMYICELSAPRIAPQV